MNRKKIYKEMEDTLGVVPSFFKTLSDSSLELEWELFKKTQVEEGAIPQKYRELIGVGLSAATKCHYCSFYHTEMAKANGATEEEIEDAVHFAKASSGWSTYINGLQFDEKEFKDEVKQACGFIASRQVGEKELRCSDVGEGCDFVIRGKSEAEIMRKAKEHARSEHGEEELSEELMEKVRGAIHSV